MAITHVGSAQGENSTGTAVSVTHGLTIQSGDVIVASISVNNNPSVTDNNGATPFTSAYGAAYNTGSARHEVWWRRAGGSEPSAYAFTLSGSNRWSIIVSVYRGVVASGDPWDVAPAAATDATGNSATPTTPALTTATDGAWGIALAAYDAATNTFSAWPADSYNAARQTTAQQSQSLSDKAIPGTAPVSQSAVSWTITSAQWLAHQFALKPEPGGAAASDVILPPAYRHQHLLGR